jgi:uncharacterized protein (TIGR02391 family)
VALLLDRATKPSLRSWLMLIAFQGLRGQEISDLTREEIDFHSRPPVLKLEEHVATVGKTAIIHPDVEAALRSLEFPDRGRLFPNDSAANVAQTIRRHFVTCGVLGSSTSLLWWYRLQVQNRGQNFDRPTGVGADLASVKVASRLHPELALRIQHHFDVGQYQDAVFAAMREIEVRVRSLARFGNEIVGVDLMTRAFRPDGGVLTDGSAVKGEQVGTMNLFAGAYAVLRNPAGHREVNYDDASEAAEAIAVASLLMRILDRVEERRGRDAK